MSFYTRLLRPALLLGFSLSALASFAADPAAEMRERIEQLKKTHEEQRKMPLEAQFALQETQIQAYEDQVYKGSTRSELYLKLARETMQQQRRVYFAKKWARTLDNEEATKELREHGQRVAELQRVHMLARARSIPIAIVRAQELLKAENARHEAHMKQLAAEAGYQVTAQQGAQ